MIPNYEDFKIGNAQVNKIYLGDDLIWEKGAPAPSYDETRIAVVLLDENDEPTDNFEYFETIADSATYLKDNAANRYLVHIGVDVGITALDDGSFSECSSLVKIYLPSGITSIGPGAFYYCSSLISIDIPNDVTSIGQGAFLHCSSLISIDIPYGVSSLEPTVFGDCTSLQDIEIPSSVLSIKQYALAGTSLAQLYIPGSVTTISEDAFGGCTSLATITVNKIEGSITGAPWGATNATVVWTK